jgi:hypothetical protein
MNGDYFVVEFGNIGDSIERKATIFRTEKDLFKYLQNNKNKKMSIYKGECILDWS